MNSEKRCMNSGKNIVEKRECFDNWEKIKVKNKKSDEQYILNKTVVFTYSPNKCHNIFTKHLFSVVVSHSFIFNYFILTYKKLTPQ